MSCARAVDKAFLFFGCQNTSLQWIDLSSLKLNGPATSGDPVRHAGASGSVTESSSDYELEFEGGEDEYEGANGMDRQAMEDADDERQRAYDGQLLLRSGTNSPQSGHGKSRRPRPPKKLHKFFDSQPRGSQTRIPTLSTVSGKSTPINDSYSTFTVPRNESFSSTGSLDKSSSLKPNSMAISGPDLSKTLSPHSTRPSRPRVLRVPSTNVADSAHYGYIYCMGLVPSPSEEVQLRPFGEFEPEARHTSDHGIWKDGEIRLVTGSGDEDVKVHLIPSPRLHSGG